MKIFWHFGGWGDGPAVESPFCSFWSCGTWDQFPAPTQLLPMVFNYQIQEI